MGCTLGGASAKQVANVADDVFSTHNTDCESTFAVCEEKILRHLLMMDDVRSHGKIPNSMQSKDQTIIVFDMDDILFPLTWALQMRCKMHSPWGERLALVELRAEHAPVLDLMSSRVVELLTLAQQLGKVLVVSNEALPWVHPTCATLMPKLCATLQRFPVVYAMAHVKAYQELQRPATDAMIEGKTQAIKAAITEACSISGDKTAMNIVCIGDLRCDFAAIREKISETSLMKSIKTLEDLAPSRMVLQQIVLTRWLSHIVHADLDLDIDFSIGEDTDAAVHQRSHM